MHSGHTATIALFLYSQILYGKMVCYNRILNLATGSTPETTSKQSLHHDAMHPSHFALKVIVLLSALSLGACATDTQSRIGTAATTPLTDLNIIRADIPLILAEAQKQPYGIPGDQTCQALAAEVQQFDAVLGADIGAPADDAKPDLLKRGTSAIENSALGALQSTAEGLVPFRGWVRKLTGAERNSKHVADAIAAGTVRRAFLKGVGLSKACVW